MDTKFFSCYILGHTGSNYITVYLLFDGCDYFISQKQEEGNLVWKMIGVNRARQVFKNRRRSSGPLVTGKGTGRI